MPSSAAAWWAHTGVRRCRAHKGSEREVLARTLLVAGTTCFGFLRVASNIHVAGGGMPSVKGLLSNMQIARLILFEVNEKCAGVVPKRKLFGTEELSPARPTGISAPIV